MDSPLGRTLGEYPRWTGDFTLPRLRAKLANKEPSGSERGCSGSGGPVRASFAAARKCLATSLWKVGVRVESSP
ncbi:unnamed protein product, partial [Prorocentrum cordatum]